MQITLYPNKEIRLVIGGGGATLRKDRDSISSKFDRTLDIPSQPSQANNRKAFKRHKLTEKARHRIMHHGGLFSDENKNRQVFLTGTLPGSTVQAMEALTHLAPQVVKSVQTYIPRYLNVGAKQLRYIWVWELQKRGALHMHLIVECENEKKASELVEGWSAIWVAVLRSAAKKADCDLFERWYGGTHKDNEENWQIKAEICKKSVARYLSKYESKGSDGERKYFPPRWYGISSQLRRDMWVWKCENTITKMMRIHEDVGVRSARIVMADFLMQFTVGGVTHKHGYGDVGGVDVFGYLKEGLTLQDVADTAWRFMDMLGISAVLRSKEKKVVQVDKEAKKMVKAVEGSAPAPVVIEVMNLATREIWDRAASGDSTSNNDIGELYWAWTYLCHLKGWKLSDQPEFAWEISEEFNGIRAKFPDQFTINPPV